MLQFRCYLEILSLGSNLSILLMVVCSSFSKRNAFFPLMVHLVMFSTVEFIYVFAS